MNSSRNIRGTCYASHPKKVLRRSYDCTDTSEPTHPTTGRGYTARCIGAFTSSSQAAHLDHRGHCNLKPVRTRLHYLGRSWPGDQCASTVEYASRRASAKPRGARPDC